jgi:hypothetical protein
MSGAIVDCCRPSLLSKLSSRGAQRDLVGSGNRVGATKVVRWFVSTECHSDALPTAPRAHDRQVELGRHHFTRLVMGLDDYDDDYRHGLPHRESTRVVRSPYGRS